MIYIIAGTNRAGSNTLKVSQMMQKNYSDLGVQTEIIDLSQVPLHLFTGEMYGQTLASELETYIQKVNRADGLVMVVPEYNGSMPGVLKYFIDLWKYPLSFEYRPVCFVGLGGMFGGLRPVEHLQQVFGYRNAFIFPERVFLQNVWKSLTENGLQDALAQKLLHQQARGFVQFIEALKTSKLHTNTRSL